MARISLPPGFRFHPTDVELVMYYLKRKVMGKKLHFEAITEVNIYNFSPWDLPDKSCLKSKDLEWFFFCAREKKYASGVRVKRSTENGFWKTTGNERPVIYNNNTVGMVKTLIFHNGHAPNGQRTDWVMHEFRILDNQLAEAGVQDTYVLCKVFKKNGRGPKNGAQYGAPFNEADWESDDDTLICSESLSPTVSALPKSKSFSGLAFKTVLGSTSGLSSIEAGPSSVGPVSDIVPNEPDDDIVRLLAPFTDDSMLHINDKENYEKCYKQHVDNEETDIYIPGSNGNDIYNGLGDLYNWVQMSEGGSDGSGMQEDGQLMNHVLPQDDVAYLELNDLIAPLDFCPEVIATEVNATEEIPFGNLFGSYGPINMNYLNFNGDISGVNQYASGQNLHHLLPEGSSRQEDCFNELQMVNNNGVSDSLGNNSANDLGFKFNQPTEGGDVVKRQKRDLNSNHYSSSSQLIQHQLERIVSFQCLTWWSLFIVHALSVMLVGTTFGLAGCSYLKKEMLQSFG